MPPIMEPVDEIGFERVFWTDDDILSFLASEYPHVLAMFKEARTMQRLQILPGILLFTILAATI
jgi:hypothetical protein